MQIKKVSVIIVNYNTSKLVNDCINSIYKHTKQIGLVEIIVVDNNSPNDNLNLLRNDKRIRLVELKTNIGFGKANNKGRELATGEFLFFLNPDILLLNDAITIMTNYLEANSDVAVVGGNLYDLNMKPTHSYRYLFPSLFTEIDLTCKRILSKLFITKNYEFNFSKQPLEVSYITGADMMVSKEVFDNVGKFDPDFFMYYEETDLCYRIKSKGYSIKSIPDAELIHLEGKSFNVSVEREKRNLNGRYLYFHKHYGFFYNVVTDIFNVLTLLIVSIALIFFPKQNKKYIIRLKLYIRKMLNMD